MTDINMTDDFDITMLSQTGCGFCKEAKTELKEKINSGKIKVIELDKDPKMMDEAIKLGVQGTPVFLVKNKVQKTSEICELSDDYKKFICKNKKININ